MRLILSVDIGDSSFLASTLCEIVGPMRLSPAFFDEHSVRGLLEKLVTHHELPKQTFAVFIASIGGRAPLEVVCFFGSAQESVKRPDFSGFCLRAGISYSRHDARQRLDTGIGVAGLQGLPS
jgi:hypothetical protein